MSLDAATFVKRVCGYSDTVMKHAFIRSLAQESPAVLVRVLDELCGRADHGDAMALDVLGFVADVVGTNSEVYTALGNAARQEQLESALRLFRRSRRPGAAEDDLDDAFVPMTSPTGRTLTLGERKALAALPTRLHLDKLLLDPHPAVIEKLLNNPALVEADVMRLVVKRPARPDTIRAVARNPKWSHRAEIRRALVLNPGTPTEVAIPFAHLLLRQDLEFVVQTTTVPVEVRSLCAELLQRRSGSIPPHTETVH